MKRKQTIKEWELETGIKVRNPKGFKGEKNKIHTNKYTSEAFRIGLQNSVISVRTDKGMKFLLGQVEDNFLIECFIDFKNERRRNKDEWKQNKVSRTKRTMQKHDSKWKMSSVATN